MPLLFFLGRIHTSFHCVNTSGYNSRDHIYRCGNRSQDDQQRNDGCKDSSAHSVLHQNQHGNRSCCQIGHVSNRQKAHNGQLHGEEIAYKHSYSRAVDLFYISHRLYMLVHNGNRRQLEKEVQYRRPESRSESAAFLRKHRHLPAAHTACGSHNAVPLNDDVRHQDQHQTDNDQHT